MIAFLGFDLLRPELGLALALLLLLLLNALSLLPPTLLALPLLARSLLRMLAQELPQQIKSRVH